MMTDFVSCPHCGSAFSLADVLTERQLAVLALAAEGLKQSQVAERLGVSLHTVKEHTQRAVRKLRAVSMPNAVAIALRKGFIT